jgi:hypothetical protein
MLLASASAAGMVVEDARDLAGTIRVRELQHRYAAAGVTALPNDGSSTCPCRPFYYAHGARAPTNKRTHSCDRAEPYIFEILRFSAPAR